MPALQNWICSKLNHWGKGTVEWSAISISNCNQREEEVYRRKSYGTLFGRQYNTIFASEWGQQISVDAFCAAGLGWQAAFWNDLKNRCSVASNIQSLSGFISYHWQQDSWAFKDRLGYFSNHNSNLLEKHLSGKDEWDLSRSVIFTSDLEGSLYSINSKVIWWIFMSSLFSICQHIKDRS